MNASKEILCEFLGTAALLIVVVGSGIMGEQLAEGNMAIALLANSIATGAGLYTLIQMFGPLSGAHFNPAVSFFEFLSKGISLRKGLAYVFAQVSGAILGVWFAHYMFGLDVFQLSQKSRGEARFFVSELAASFGLILLIALLSKSKRDAVPQAVALYITAAYWCTSSTSFANPAVTIARALTDTFSGILWTGTSAFIAAQFIGAAFAFFLARKLIQNKH